MRNAAFKYLQVHAPGDTVEIFEDGHYADDDIEVLEEFAEELVQNTNVKVIVAAGGPQSAIAAMDATNEADAPRDNTPVVFTTVADPVGLGLVNSLNAPGRNLTGMAGSTSETDPERLRLFHAFVSQRRPATQTKVGVLINPVRQGYPKMYRPLRDMADGLGLKLVPRRAKNRSQIIKAFKEFKGAKFLGAVVTADAFFNNNRNLIIAQAKKHAVPTIYQWRAFVVDGGLMSYGPSIVEAYQKAGEYAAQICAGLGVPANMPCTTPAGFELVVKTDTAHDLNLLPVPNPIGGVPVDEI